MCERGLGFFLFAFFTPPFFSDGSGQRVKKKQKNRKRCSHPSALPPNKEWSVGLTVAILRCSASFCSW